MSFTNLSDLRRTGDDKLGGTIRIFLGLLFVMTGAMKLLVPTLAEAWSGQLLAAELPFYTLSRWSVPFVEMAVQRFQTVTGWLAAGGQTIPIEDGGLSGSIFTFHAAGTDYRAEVDDSTMRGVARRDNDTRTWQSQRVQ